MYCKNCGNKLDDDAKFCTKCGTKTDLQIIEPELTVKEPVNTDEKKHKSHKHHKSHKPVILVGTVAVLAVALAGGILVIKKTGMAKTSAELVQEDIEKTYGIAEGTLYGKRIVHSETTSGSETTEETKFLDGTKGGAVLYKNLTFEDNTKGGISVYLCDDDENNEITLKARYTDDKNYSRDMELASPKIYDTELTSPEMIETCYPIIGQNHFAFVVQREEKELKTGDWTYMEFIFIYELTPGEVKDSYLIHRYMNRESAIISAGIVNFSGTDAEETSYTNIKGYSDLTSEDDRVTYVATEQEINDQIRKVLQDNLLECINVKEMSPEDRWNEIHVDQNSTKNAIAKVEFASANPHTDENGDEVTDITITVNGEDSKKAK